MPPGGVTEVEHLLSTKLGSRSRVPIGLSAPILPVRNAGRNVGGAPSRA
jgi:hypothetical protein